MADITSQTLRPSLNPRYQTVEDAQLWLNTDKSKEQSLFFTSLFNTVDTPIVGYDPSRNNNKVTVVQRTSSLQFGSSWLISPHLQVGVDFGFNVVQLTDSTYFGIGDFHFTAKQSLFQKGDDWGFSVAPDFYVPVPNSHPFMSNEAVGYGGRLFFEKNMGGVGIAVNAGYLQFPGATYGPIDYSAEFPLGIGIRVPISAKVAFNMEGTTTALANSLADGPGDLYVGARVGVFRGGTLDIGGSYAILPSDGSASVRILVGLNILPRTKDPIEIIVREKTKQTHTVQKCSPESTTIHLPGRSLLPKEKKKLKALPFLVSNSGPFKTIDLGQPTGTTKGGVRYNENSQMIFAIDLSTLPLRQDVISLESILLKMKVHKLLHHQDSRSGMLCLVNEKVCSGDIPTSKVPRENINSSFFAGKEPPNDFFMRSIQGSEKYSTEKDGVITTNLNLPLQKLLENSVVPEPTDVIYDQTGEPKKTLFLATAPDIYILNDVSLEVQMTVESCKTSNSETVTEEEGH